MIAGLILAAGSSTRLGRPKQLLPFKGSTLIGSVTNQVLMADTDSVFAVVGANADAVSDALPDAVTVVPNPRWAEGQATSLKAGVESILLAGGEPDGILVVLADQPLVTAAFLNRLIAAQEARPETDCVAAAYPQGAGVPAVFAGRVLPMLTGLSGDQGARSLLRSPEIAVDTIVPDFGLVDVDTEADYAALLARDDVSG